MDHSPALILHGVEFDSDIKNYKNKADTDKNQGTFIIILFHFSAPFDFNHFCVVKMLYILQGNR